jgi:DNA-binding CsgD family transcriptional regulator
MNHLYFAFYGISLLSGFMLFGILISNEKIRHSQRFNSFLQVYLTVSAFVLVATSCLYIKVNMVGGQITDYVFFSSIPLFLASLAFLIIRHESLALNAPVYSQLKYWLLLSIFAGLTLSGFIWCLPSNFYIVGILSSIVIFIVMLVSNYLLLRPYKKSNDKRHKISNIMTLQSIVLPMLEFVFLHEELGQIGMSLSMPLVYIINNLLIWRFRDELFPVNQTRTINLPTILTSKEQQVVQYVVKGLSNKLIADQLNISPSTVKNHLYTIYKKLDVTNRVALMAVVMTRCDE